MLPRTLVIAGLFALAPSPHAALIGVQFEGVVFATSGNGVGYSVGQTILGSLPSTRHSRRSLCTPTRRAPCTTSTPSVAIQAS